MLGSGNSDSPALMGLTFNGFKGKHNVFLRDLGKVGDLEICLGLFYGLQTIESYQTLYVDVNIYLKDSRVDT